MTGRFQSSRVGRSLARMALDEEYVECCHALIIRSRGCDRQGRLAVSEVTKVPNSDRGAPLAP